MSGGLFGLLDDIAALAKLAAASIDDVGAAAGRASAKAAGVVVDDTAVTPAYVQGLAAERELRDTKGQIKLLNRQARQATTVQEQHELQERIRELEAKKRRLRQRIFDVEDEITAKRDKLIDALERRMQQRTSSERLFAVRWSVV